MYKKMSLMLLSCVGVSAYADVVKLADTGKTDLKVRAIDSFEVMRMCKEGQEVQKELEGKRDSLTNSLKDDEQKFTQAANEFKSKAPTLSESAREKEEKKIVKLKRDLENKVQESEEEMKTAMQSATERLSRDVENAVAELAASEKIDMVADKMSGRILYVSEKADFTGKVIAKMDTKKGEQVAQAKKTETQKATA